MMTQTEYEAGQYDGSLPLGKPELLDVLDDMDYSKLTRGQKMPEGIKNSLERRKEAMRGGARVKVKREREDEGERARSKGNERREDHTEVQRRKLGLREGGNTRS